MAKHMSLEKKSNICGLGRRKTSTATIFLIPHLDKTSKSFFEVNGRLGEEYFQYNFNYLHQIHGPLRKLELMQEYKMVAKVKGGGLTGQANAIQLALARALCDLDPTNFRSALKVEGYLSRDARMKERRKYGLKKARKASQSSKR
jgi:small subunit ribosomal protein S9